MLAAAEPRGHLRIKAIESDDERSDPESKTPLAQESPTVAETQSVAAQGHSSEPVLPSSPLDLLIFGDAWQTEAFFNDSANVKLLFANAESLTSALIKKLPPNQAVALLHPQVTERKYLQNDYLLDAQAAQDWLATHFAERFFRKHPAYQNLSALQAYFLFLGDRECTKANAGDEKRKTKINAFRLLFMLDKYLRKVPDLAKPAKIKIMLQAMAYAVTLAPQSAAMKKLQELCTKASIPSQAQPQIPAPVAASIAEEKIERLAQNPESKQIKPENPEQALKDIYEMQILSSQTLATSTGDAAQAAQLHLELQRTLNTARQLGIDIQLESLFAKDFPGTKIPAQPVENKMENGSSRLLSLSLRTLREQLQRSERQKSAIDSAINAIGQVIDQYHPRDQIWQTEISKHLEELNQEQIYLFTKCIMKIILKAASTQLVHGAAQASSINIERAWFFCSFLYLLCLKKSDYAFLVQANARVPDGLVEIHELILKRIHRKLDSDPAVMLSEKIAALLCWEPGMHRGCLSDNLTASLVRHSRTKQALSKLVECAPLHNNIHLNALAESCSVREFERRLSDSSTIHLSLHFPSQREIASFKESVRTFLEVTKFLYRNLIATSVLNLRGDPRVDDPVAQDKAAQQAEEQLATEIMSDFYHQSLKQRVENYCNDVYQLILENIRSQQIDVRVYVGFAKISVEQAALELTRSLLFYQFHTYKEETPPELLWKGEGSYFIGTLIAKISKKIAAEINIWYAQQTNTHAFAAGLNLPPASPLFAGLCYGAPAPEDNFNSRTIVTLLTTSNQETLRKYFNKSKSAEIKNLFMCADAITEKLLPLLPKKYELETISEKLPKTPHKYFSGRADKILKNITSSPATLLEKGQLQEFLRALHRYEIHKPDDKADATAMAARKNRAAMFKLILLLDMLFEDRGFEPRWRASTLAVIIQSVTGKPEELGLQKPGFIAATKESSSLKMLNKLGKFITEKLNTDPDIYRGPGVAMAHAAAAAARGTS